MDSYETSRMSVKQEIKSQLAKLLATEDLVVEHKQVQTACFNVHTRVLTLPLWEKASNVVYDLLVGHEVGHALFTPDEDWLKEHKIPPQFVNVVEDARIEKLMKRKYMGLAKTFFNGYKELNEQDFFSIEEEDISTFNLADRANLFFKIGNFVNVPMESDQETEIINMIAETETFADVLIAAEELYKYCKQKQQEETKTPMDDLESQTSGSQQPASDFSDQQEGENEESEESNSDSVESENQSQDTPESSIDGSKGEDDPEVKTMDSLEEALKNLVNEDGYENTYIEIPEVNLDTVIASNSEVHDEINNYFEMTQKSHELLASEKNFTPINLFEVPDAKYNEFKNSSKKEVNYLVKEFECKKSADSYARATTARTGVLDCTKLHTYKYNEDLFKKVTTLADGKNHGLVFILDWSGSMSQVMEDTCKQLFNLVWFCKKVGIPFDVYAFTCEWRRRPFDYKTNKYLAADLTPHCEKKEGMIAIDDSFSLMNIMTSKTNNKELDHQMKNIWRLASYFGNTYHCQYSIPFRLSLSGTPLNEALITLHQILPKFQKENKLQKVQCIVLTDGEANHLPYYKEVKRHWENEPYLGCRHISPNSTFLRDRKLGTTYMFEYGWHTYTDILLKNLKDKFPNVNFIGMRLLMGRDASRFISLYYDEYNEREKVLTEWKKMRSFIIKKSGYDAYFGLSANALSNEVEFDVKEDATKAQIKSAFAKSLKTKKLNKKVLGEFISLVV